MRWFFGILRRHWWPLILLALTIGLCGVTVRMLIWPAYKNPISRMYTSKLGYASVLRQTGRPFPVTTCAAQSRNIEGHFLGEGLMQSEPVQVPMIAMARIEKIFVQEGDRVVRGQHLVSLDSQRIKLRIEAAKAALETARAEYERVRVGSVNVLLDERPELGRIQLESAESKLEAEAAILDRYRPLLRKGSISREAWLEQQLKLKEAEVEFRKLKLSNEFAAQGKENSMRIAESTIREAEMAWQHRVLQLADYDSYAPADGIVERVLVHDGEYNQDPGRPAMLLASGLWFEANMDQTALGQIAPGDLVEVRLSAFQDRVFAGVVERIKPLVNFSLGGPETNRPIRPLGTGAPEWPATFAVRIHLETKGDKLVPGLTGFARVTNTRNSICVPRGAVTATSGNHGLVFVVDQQQDGCRPRDVVVGWTDDGWTEIRSGLADGEVVVVEGHQVLEPGDQIVCRRMEEDATTSKLMPPAKIMAQTTAEDSDTHFQASR